MVDGSDGVHSAPADVMVQELPEEELIFLNLSTEQYFGSDRVGTRMYRALVECGTLASALERLSTQFDVAVDVLAADLREYAGTLVERGLLELRRS